MEIGFWDFTPEERREWRTLDMTKAYINELRKQHAQAMKTCVSAAKTDAIVAAGWAGAVDGLETAASIAGDDK